MIKNGEQFDISKKVITAKPRKDYFSSMVALLSYAI